MDFEKYGFIFDCVFLKDLLCGSQYSDLIIHNSVDYRLELNKVVSSTVITTAGSLIYCDQSKKKN